MKYRTQPDKMIQTMQILLALSDIADRATWGIFGDKHRSISEVRENMQAIADTDIPKTMLDRAIIAAQSATTEKAHQAMERIAPVLVFPLSQVIFTG
jgi:hypothetical protein